MSNRKIPVSVLVVMISPNGDFLLIERADRPAYWQSVTGSLDFPDELPLHAAIRELREETGFEASAVHSPTLIDAPKTQLLTPGYLRPWPHSVQYKIFEHWQHRYPVGVTHNTEHWFMVCLPAGFTPQLAAREHVGYAWLNAQHAANRCFSPSNTQAILDIEHRLSGESTHGKNIAPEGCI